MATEKSISQKGKMSRSQAGRAGGLAPHKCRGRQCENQNKENREKRSSSFSNAYPSNSSSSSTKLASHTKKRSDEGWHEGWF
ncbi:MAG TPA: hypothetical protein VHA52_01880 [Candidatus Babeliaceae bacterium]|nr:hypothetical protein [Candidatus Babeliaceae bacterium]